MDKKGKKVKWQPLVMIEWCDAQSDCDWNTKESIEKWASKDCIIVDVGWVIFEGDKYIVIASQFGKDDGDWGNRTKIPKDWIRKRTKLRFK